MVIDGLQYGDSTELLPGRFEEIQHELHIAHAAMPGIGA